MCVGLWTRLTRNAMFIKLRAKYSFKALNNCLWPRFLRRYREEGSAANKSCRGLVSILLVNEFLITLLLPMLKPHPKRSGFYPDYTFTPSVLFENIPPYFSTIYKFVIAPRNKFHLFSPLQV